MYDYITILPSKWIFCYFTKKETESIDPRRNCVHMRCVKLNISFELFQIEEQTHMIG